MKVKNENDGILGSFKGILGGIILIIGSIILLWWNEGNNVRNIKATNEARKEFIQVSSEQVDPNNEGKLIATNGELKTDAVLEDPEFDININTINFERNVEMYQWEETSHDDGDGYTTYDYNKVWSSDLIDSSNFQDKTKVNPTDMKYSNIRRNASSATIGAFELNMGQINMLGTNTNYVELNNELATSKGLFVHEYYYTTYENEPKIGDVRLSFRYNDSKEASVLALQSGNTFTEYNAKSGKTINEVANGIKTGEELITSLENSNSILKWVLRLVGTLLCIAGFAAILNPIVKLGNYIPILGKVVSSAIGLICLLCGLAISLVVISISWLFYRPLIGIILLLVVGALIYLAIKYSKKKQVNEMPEINEPIEI